jgi:hypothetical protein
MALWLEEKDAHNSTLQTLLGERGLLLEEKNAHNATLQQLVAEQQKVCDEKEKRCQMLERLLEKERRCHLLEKEMAERHLQPLRAETPWQDQLILPHSRLWNTHQVELLVRVQLLLWVLLDWRDMYLGIKEGGNASVIYLFFSFESRVNMVRREAPEGPRRGVSNVLPAPPMRKGAGFE